MSILISTIEKSLEGATANGDLAVAPTVRAARKASSEQVHEAITYLEKKLGEGLNGMDLRLARSAFTLLKSLVALSGKG